MDKRGTSIEAFQRLREAIEKAGPRNMAPEEVDAELEKARVERYFKCDDGVQ